MMRTHKDFFKRLRARLYGWYERQFPTPIDSRLLEILGGTTLTIGALRHNGYPLTLTLSRGRLLRSERFRRQVLGGKGVLASDVKWAIQIMGPEYERQVVSMYERDEKLEAAGWRLLYVRWQDVWHNPKRVRRDVLQFLH